MSNTTRRDFLKQGAALTAGALLVPPFLAERSFPVKHLGIQLYSVRDDIKKDAVGTIKSVAKMGYKEVEGFGYNEGKMFGLSVKEYMSVLKGNGLTMPSSHCGFSLKDYNESSKSLTDGAKKAIDDAVVMGQKYIICPYMNEPVEKLVKVYAAAGEYAKKAGTRFGFHNHAHEFEQKGPDGRLIIEWLLNEIDPSIMAMEMDIYWVQKAKNNPLDWFKKYPGRWELCHAKDMAKTEKQETVEVGDGSIDFPAIFRQSKQAGLKYYIVELEHYVTTPLEGIQRARKNFIKMKLK